MKLIGARWLYRWRIRLFCHSSFTSETCERILKGVFNRYFTPNTLLDGRTERATDYPRSRFASKFWLRMLKNSIDACVSESYERFCPDTLIEGNTWQSEESEIRAWSHQTDFVRMDLWYGLSSYFGVVSFGIDSGSKGMLKWTGRVLRACIENNASSALHQQYHPPTPHVSRRRAGWIALESFGFECNKPPHTRNPMCLDTYTERAQASRTHTQVPMGWRKSAHRIS